MTDAQPPAPTPGWYPDPSGQHAQRWWNGQDWTDNVQDARPAGADVKIDKGLGWAVLGGAGAMALGSFLPWATITAPFIGTVSKDGIEGDGVLTLIAAGVIALLAFPLMQQKMVQGRVIAALVVAALAAVIVMYDYVDVSRVASDIESEGTATAKVGIGLQIAGLGVIATVGGTAGALYEYSRDRRRQRAAEPPPD